MWNGEGSFEQFQMTVSRRSFTVMEPDASVQIPEGLTETKITIDGHAVKGWVWGNETEHQYVSLCYDEAVRELYAMT